jgi:hypothetical protein
MLIPFGGLLRQVNISEAHISERKVIYSPEFNQWYELLTKREKRQVRARVRHLQSEGPVVGRPTVGLIKGSIFHQMKELLVPKDIRILLMFDTQGSLVLLVGGNKSERDPSSPNWNRWYQKMIPIAENIYSKHLEQLEEPQ